MKTAKHYKISLNEASNNLAYYSIIYLVILSHMFKVSRLFQDTKYRKGILIKILSSRISTH